MSYARTAVTRMTLDMARPDLQRSETVTLGDTNRRWEVTLINGGAPFRLPPNWTAALTGIKPDGTGLLNGCSVADGKIIYDFAAGAEIATCAGNYPVQFDIWDEVGDLVASPKLYVNVLDDARPHAELDSEGQYTLIGNLIGRVNQTDADVDLLGETALAQGDDIAALKKKVTTAGSVTIPTEEWSDDTPRTARFKIEGLGNGMTALLYPSDEATRKEASRVKLSAYPQLYLGTEGSQVEVVVSSAEVVPTKALYIDYIVIKTDNTEAWPRVALIGVDAYGEEGGTGSGVDETAVKKIINSVLGNVANERQYSAANPPPYPVTSVNGQTGVVNLNASDVGARPSTWMPTAADVGADPAETAERKTAALREEVNGKLADYDKSIAVNNKISSHNTSTESHTDLRLELQRLSDRLNAALNSDDTSLDDLKEIVAYIKSNKTLIDGVTASKVNVSDIANNLITNTPNVPLSAAQGVALKLLIDSLEEIVEGKTTPEQVAAQIKAALTGYITKEDADKTYQPAGDYLTESDLPAIPDKLPNPHALTINGQTYNGSSPVEVTIEGGGSDADLAAEVIRMKKQQPNLFVDAVQTGNLIDASMMHNGGRVQSDGNINTTNSASFSYSDFVDISKAVGTHLAVYVMHKSFVGQTSPAQYLNYAQIVYRMCFYDADKVKISYHEVGGGKIADGSTVNETTRAKGVLAIPDNAVYVRVSYTGALTTSSINKYMVVRGDEADLNPLPPYSEYEPVREAVVVPEDLNPLLDKVRSAGKDQHQDNAVLTVTTLNNSATFSENDITFVGDELWIMKDDSTYTNGTRIFRYRVDGETFEYLGYIDGDFGHLNTMDYCAANDCLIFGNGGNDEVTTGNYFVVIKHPMTITYNTTTTIAELVADGQAIKYDLDSTIGSIGYKVQALWGDSNLGANNRVILIASNTTVIKEVLLSKTDGEFNGGLIVVKSHTDLAAYGVQGADYWGGYLYIGGQGTTGDGRYQVCKVSMADPTQREIIAMDFFMEDGTVLSGCVQGICVEPNYIWIATNASSGQTPSVAITKYRR